MRASRWCDARRLVDELLRALRIPERPQGVAGPEKRQSGAIAFGQLADGDFREHRLRFFAAA